MTVLLSPNGDRYVTDNPREITNLTLGHGYRYAPENPPTSAPDSHKPLDLIAREPRTRKRPHESLSPAREPGSEPSTDGGE